MQILHPESAARKPLAKWRRVALALLDGPKTSRDLERAPVFDHCAHSTVSELRNKSIEIDTEIVTVAGYAGRPTRIARYSIAAASMDLAREIVVRRGKR